MNPWRELLKSLQSELDRLSQEVKGRAILPNTLTAVLPAARFEPWAPILEAVTAELGEALVDWAKTGSRFWYAESGPCLTVRLDQERTQPELTCEFRTASGEEPSPPPEEIPPTPAPAGEPEPVYAPTPAATEPDPTPTEPTESETTRDRDSLSQIELAGLGETADEPQAEETPTRPHSLELEPPSGSEPKSLSQIELDARLLAAYADPAAEAPQETPQPQALPSEPAATEAEPETAADDEPEDPEEPDEPDEPSLSQIELD